VHPTSGILRVFKQFAWLEVNSVKMALAHPAHLRVTQAVGPLSLNRKVLLMSDFQYFLKWLSENSCLSMRAAEITGREPAHDILEDR
jgi:hypothetical protein